MGEYVKTPHSHNFDQKTYCDPNTWKPESTATWSALILDEENVDYAG